MDPPRRFDSARATREELSPDLKWALAIRGSGATSFVLLPTGPGEPRIVKGNLTDHCWADFFPDGTRVGFDAAEPGHRRRTYVQEIAGGVPRPVTPEGVEAAQLLPDGRFLVARDETGKLVLYPVEGEATAGTRPT